MARFGHNGWWGMRRAGSSLVLHSLCPCLLNSMWVWGLWRIVWFQFGPRGHCLNHDLVDCLVCSFLYSLMPQTSWQNVPECVPIPAFPKPVSTLRTCPWQSLPDCFSLVFDVLCLWGCAPCWWQWHHVWIHWDRAKVRKIMACPSGLQKLALTLLVFLFCCCFNRLQSVEEHGNYANISLILFVISHTWITPLVKFKEDCSSES